MSSCQYYYPDLADPNQSSIGKRLEWMEKYENISTTIRFKENQKDVEFLFLCDTWPDVTFPTSTCRRWNLPPNKVPLFKVNALGSFRTIRHFFYFQFFKTFDQSFAAYFTWTHRHAAAVHYQAFLQTKHDMKIAKERKKSKPSESKIEKWMAECHIADRNGLRGSEAIRLASWDCYRSHQKGDVKLNKSEFVEKLNVFKNRYGAYMYACAVYYMYEQDPQLKEALLSGTKHGLLLSVGDFRKEVWDFNSGHNLLGEIHMHYRNVALSNSSQPFCKIYKNRIFELMTSYRPGLAREMKNNDRDMRKEYFEKLYVQMGNAGKGGRWDDVEKLAQSIWYLCTNTVS